MQCKTIRVSASSCVALRWERLVVAFDDCIWRSSVNPPATTISLSGGRVCANSSRERKLARSALFPCDAMKLDQQERSGTFRPSSERLRAFFNLHRLWLSADLIEVSLYLSNGHNVYQFETRRLQIHLRSHQKSVPWEACLCYRLGYTEARNAVTASITKAKIEYCREKLESADSKFMFRFVKSLSGQQNDIFPEFDNPQNGCEKFSDLFWQRYKRSGQSLTHPSLIYYLMRWPASTSCRPPSGEEILQIMTHMTKTCDLDPLPASHHKQCLQTIVPVVTNCQQVITWGDCTK